MAPGAQGADLRVCFPKSVSSSVLAIEIGGVGLMLLIASVFLVTFAIVVVVGYVVLGGKKPGPVPAPASPVDAGPVAAPAPEAAPASEAAPTAAIGADRAPQSDPTQPAAAVRIRLPKVYRVLAAIGARLRQPRPPRGSLTEAEAMQAVEMVRDGLPLSEAARAVYPEFDRLDAAARHDIETRLQQLARTEQEER